MEDIENDEKVCSRNWIFKKSWFINGKIDNEKVPEEDNLNAYIDNRNIEYNEAEIVDDMCNGNIIRTCWDGSCLATYLLGCENLDFAICQMELQDGNLEVNAEYMTPLKWHEDDEGWLIYDYDATLLDINGNKTERLYDFDHTEENDIFRVPYTDLDMNAFMKGEIVLTKEAEEKWKKILSGEIPQPHYGRRAVNETDVKESACQNSCEQGSLTDYFVIINEKGTNRTVALYSDSDGLYIKGDSLDSLKVMSEEKFYIQTASGLAKEFSQIKPSPETWLKGKPKGYSMEAGFCDIVSKRKKGEDSDGNFDGNINKLDELLQL